MATIQMESMNIEAKKVELISKITRLIDYSVLLELEKILYKSEEESEEWDSLTNIEKEKIEKGLYSIKKGKVISHSVVTETINQFIKEL
jgi:methionine synthase II (cobalamin-independent)